MHHSFSFSSFIFSNTFSYISEQFVTVLNRNSFNFYRIRSTTFLVAVKIETNPKVVGGLRVESVREPMVSNRLIASSLVAYVIVAFLFDVTGWKSLFLNLLVMFLVYFGFNPNNRLKLKMEFAIVRRKYTNGEGDNDDNNGNLHRRAAGTPDQAN